MSSSGCVPRSPCLKPIYTFLFKLYNVLQIWHSLPAKTNNQYQVSDPDTNQLYVFDVNGRHLMTNNVITNSLLYRFSYSADGFLTTATDVNDNALRISYASGGVSDF